MYLLMLTLLAACAPAQAPPTVVPAAIPTINTIGETLDKQASGEVVALGYLLSSPQGAVLADGLRFPPDAAPTPIEDAAVWLEGAAELPAGTPVATGSDERYSIVEARGRLEGPGEYGPAGQYRYRMVAPTVRPFGVRDITLPLLLQNSNLYERQVVRLSGQLLASSDSAILVERIGAGGVPEDAALQLKLARPPRDPGVLERLQTATGDIRFGPVEITGLWRDGRLYPLAVLNR